MKKFRSTAFMALFVAVLGGYTLYEFRKTMSEGIMADGERMAFTIGTDKVERVRLTRGGILVELTKSGDKWNMTKPVVDEADESAVIGFVYPLLSQRIRGIQNENERPVGPINWAEFGLDPPDAVIEVMAGKKTEALSISSKNAFNGNFFVRQNDELLLGDPALAQLKERLPSTFRSRRIWREENVTVFAIRIEHDKQDFRLSMKDGEWVSEPKTDFAISKERVVQWMGSVQDYLPSDFEKEGLSGSDPTHYLLTKPSLKVTIDYKKPDGHAGQWVLNVGQERAGDIFLYTTDRPTLYKSSAASIAPLKVSLDYFRDTHTMFDFPLEQATKIEIKDKAFTYSLKKDGSDWLLENGGDFEVDQAHLINWMQNLKQLKAEEYPGAASEGLKNPQVRILDGKGELLLSIAWGGEYKAKESYNAGAPFRFVRTNRSASVAGVPKAKIDQLIDPRIVKKKAVGHK